MVASPPPARALRIHRVGHPTVALALESTRVYTFGRAPRARILMPSPHVSRLHGQLDAVGGRWTFVDPGTPNGSYLFRVRDLIFTEATGELLPCVRLAPGQPGWLRSGEGVLLGCREMWFELLREVPPDAVGPDRANPPSVQAWLSEPAEERRTPDLLPELLDPDLGV